MGRRFFTGTDGMINEHVYPPMGRKIKFLTQPLVIGSRVFEWPSTGQNDHPISHLSDHHSPVFNRDSNTFELNFKGHLLNYGASSKFNKTVTNVYLVYKLNIFTKIDNPKYPLKNALFGAIRVDKKKDKNPKKWSYRGKGIAMDASKSFSMGSQGLAHNVVIFGVDNSSSKHSVNRGHNFMILGNVNTQLIENVNSIPEKGLAINMTYPGKKFVLSIHYTGANSQLYVNGILMTVFGDKNYSDPKDHVGFSLGNISTDFNEEESLFMGLDGNVYEVFG